MDAELKRLWTDALRSGDYEKGKGFLCREIGGRTTWCCLGVLYDVAADAWWERFDGIFPAISNEVVWKAGVSPYLWGAHLFGDIGTMNGLEVESQLARFNDNEDKSFAEIADWIDENL